MCTSALSTVIAEPVSGAEIELVLIALAGKLPARVYNDVAVCLH